MAHHIDTRTHECIDRCRTCQDVCLEMVNHCLAEGGRHAEADHIRTLLACAEICDTAARFMLLASTNHMQVCDVCAEVSDTCAESCEPFGDDEAMQRCVEACRRCAESCRQMARAAA